MAILDPPTPNVQPKTAEIPSPPTSSNPFSLKQYSPGVRKIASFGLSLFLIGLTITAFWAPAYWVISVLCSSACMALGWLTGFLFGVPRVGAAAASDSSSARINTNLEQISDWLTKILVGVGLTQIGKLPHALGEVSRRISRGYGNSANDVFSGSMVLYFSTLGFLTGYLLTRLFLQTEFDTEAEGKIEVNTKGPAEIRVTQPAPADPKIARETAAALTSIAIAPTSGPPGTPVTLTLKTILAETVERVVLEGGNRVVPVDALEKTQSALAFHIPAPPPGIYDICLTAGGRDLPETARFEVTAS